MCSKQAHFLGRPKNRSHRSLGLEAELFDDGKCSPANEGSGTVVHCSLTDVPRVEVTADDDHFIGFTSAH